MTKYKCRNCEYICTEEDMLGDSVPADDGEIWTNWICPNCKEWFFDLKSWTALEDE